MSDSGLFEQPRKEKSGFAAAALFGAVAVIVVVLGGILFANRKHHAPVAGAVLPLDARAATVELTDLAMSESTSLSGGKSTFLDGKIRNAGTQTVSGVTVQVLFRNDVGMAPQVETLPMQLIRAREPYVDTQPVSASPIAAGEAREFRLPFENISENWNMQMPEVRVVGVATK